MKDSKYARVRQPNLSSARMRSPKVRVWGKLHCNVGLIILAGVSALLVMFGRESSERATGTVEDFKRIMISAPSLEEPLPWWDHKSYRFQPNVSDWDERRATWMREHPRPSHDAGDKPHIMMVSGSAPEACDPTILSHLLLRAAKNKLNYCRKHDIELFYNMAEVDDDFSASWEKLPVLRMLMVQHPQVDWVWWLDTDAVITDLSFEPPYPGLNDNLVLYGNEAHVFNRTWTGLSTSNFMIRNSQWGLDLLDEWASMGIAGVREDAGNLRREQLQLSDQLWDFPLDDRASLVALLAQDKRNAIGRQRWAPMVKLVKETEYVMAANWTVVAPKLEELNLPGHEGAPFVTHFAGCLPSCHPKPQTSVPRDDACLEQLGRAFDFADNQVYKEFGFEPRELGDHLRPLRKKPPTEAVEKELSADGEEIFRMEPRYTDWDERRLAWMLQHPPTKRDEVILVTGSAPKPCEGKQGNHYLLWGLKNMIDYSRKNGVSSFYNDATLDKNLTGWWSKLPLLRMLMTQNPGTEWIWWLDSDAPITDMDYRLDFARYNSSGYNVVMYGDENGLYNLHFYNGINTGNVLFRNCQWSLDLLDRWGSFGATHELRVKNEALINDNLPNRPHGWEADDQSVLAFLLVTEREKWGPKTGLETTIAMSGYWPQYARIFRDDFPAEERPFVTHFAGCTHCPDPDPNDEEMVWCHKAQQLTYYFADNQVLEQYGLRHVNLNSSKLLQRSSIIVNETQAVGGDEKKHLQVTEAAKTESVGDAGEEQKVHEPEENADSIQEEKVDDRSKVEDVGHQARKRLGN